MDAQAFKDSYMQKIAGTFNGPYLAAMVQGIPAADGTIGPEIEMSIPGIADDERVGTVGIFDSEPNNPAAAKYGLAPYMRQTTPMRRYGSFSHPTIEGGIPAHADFNEEATREYYPKQMEGVLPGNMPGYLYK